MTESGLSKKAVLQNQDRKGNPATKNRTANAGIDERWVVNPQGYIIPVVDPEGI